MGVKAKLESSGIVGSFAWVTRECTDSLVLLHLASPTWRCVSASDLILRSSMLQSNL